MRLLAAGFNGHGQLSSTRGPSITEFTEVVRGPTCAPMEVCWAGWSDVVLRIGDRYFWRGEQGCVVFLDTGTGRDENYVTDDMEPMDTDEKDSVDTITGRNGTQAAPYLRSFFGTHDGCRGAVNADYCPVLLSNHSASSQTPGDIRIANFIPRLTLPSGVKCQLSNVAVAGTGKTTATVCDPNSAHHLLEFETLDKFLDFARFSKQLLGQPHSFGFSAIPDAPVKALNPGQTFCVAYTSSSVHSWGWDARYDSSLGRPTDLFNPPTIPSPVLGFSGDDGQNIKKVATCQGGHLAAVLTKDGCVYLWGSCGLEDPLVHVLQGEQPHRLGIFIRAEEYSWEPSIGPLPVEIKDLPDEDIVDVGVGVSHVVLVDRERGVWVAGDNSQGQLGLGLKSEDGSQYLPEFKKLSLELDDRSIKGVACGWYSTFLIVESDEKSKSEVFI